MKKSKLDHIQIEGGTMRLICENCERDYQPGMPAPVDIYLAIARAFEKIHKSCKKRGISNEQRTQ